MKQLYLGEGPLPKSTILYRQREPFSFLADAVGRVRQEVLSCLPLNSTHWSFKPEQVCFVQVERCCSLQRHRCSTS